MDSLWNIYDTTITWCTKVEKALAFRNMVKATTLLQSTLLASWTVLCDTPTIQKNVLFSQYIPSLAVLEEFALMISLEFVPGLFDVLKSTMPPTVQYFKTLPVETYRRWAIYLLVLEKSDHRPKIYIGSGTETSQGIRGRLRDYDRNNTLPKYVKRALDEGFTIVHKGLICWTTIPIPSLQSKVEDRGHAGLLDGYWRDIK